MKRLFVFFAVFVLVAFFCLSLEIRELKRDRNMADQAIIMLLDMTQFTVYDGFKLHNTP